MFSSVELTEPRGRAFWASVGVHVVLLTVLLLVPLIMTDTLKLHPYDVVTIVPPPEKKQIVEVTPYRLPPIPRQSPKPQPVIAPPPRRPAVTSETLRKPAPEVEKLEPVKSADVRLNPKPLPSTAPETAPKLPKPEVKVGAFANDTLKPTVNLPPHQVQTGGFGDPNGVRGEGRPDKVANVASLGSFDLPAGPGAGNGSGGASGARGVVAGGFDGAASNSQKSAAVESKAVRQSGFGDAQPAPMPQARKQEVAVRETPVEITFKPKPDYTEEGRRKKVEGEVLLRIAFGANGEVRVLDTLRTLGYGLDQNALRAAQQIQFKPATRDGRPVDSTAVVHIVFQLAY